MKTIAIYHKDCTDGTTAAAVVLKKYPDALVFPLTYGYEQHELDEIVARAEPGDRIMAVDGAFGAREFLAAGHAVTAIDHHAGAEAEYKALAAENPKFTFIFDNSKSGASLTWATLFPGEPMPEIIKYVEDADLWTWKYGQKTKDVNNYLFLLENEPAETLALFGADLSDVESKGAIITRYADLLIDHDVKTTEPLDVRLGDHIVPFYNITVLKSASGNILAQTRGKAVGLFTVDGDKVTISFRSLDAHTPSALDLAKLVNGGGHKNAAGAAMPLDAFIAAIVKKS